MRSPRTLAASRGLLSAAVALCALGFAACDSADLSAADTPPDLAPLPSNAEHLVVEVFEEVESLFDLGFDNGFGKTGNTGYEAARLGLAQASAMQADTTTYTGVYNSTLGKGYLVQLTHRQPQGVSVWGTRVQHGLAVDHDGDANTAALNGVESVNLTFTTAAQLDAFVAALKGGTVNYLKGTGSAAASFDNTSYDTWRVGQVYSPTTGGAVVTYANAEARESYTIREPVVTLNANGTGSVRDGGANGAVRTRYYEAGFTVNADGSFTGTLLRTLLSSGENSSGSVISRTEFPNGDFRQTKQRGGDGVVVRENSEG
jgi:hypothetical protein